jgi:hypothetical protein
MKTKLFQHGDHGDTESTESFREIGFLSELCASVSSVLKAVGFFPGRDWSEARWSH